MMFDVVDLVDKLRDRFSRCMFLCTCRDIVVVVVVVVVGVVEREGGCEEVLEVCKKNKNPTLRMLGTRTQHLGCWELRRAPMIFPPTVGPSLGLGNTAGAEILEGDVWRALKSVPPSSYGS